MATYGLVTYRANGTPLLTNSTKSGLFGTTATATATGTAGTITTITYTQYTGRTIRPIQLNPGSHIWAVTYPSSVPTITFTEASSTDTAATFSPQATTLYVFVK